MNVPEAPLERTEHGLLPAGEGWFVLNAKDARWHLEGTGGKLTFFEGDRAGFAQLGINVSVLEPGRPMAMYHWEDEQEDFLVLSGEAVLVAVGTRLAAAEWGAYTVDETAAGHDASVEEETTDPSVAYARFPQRRATAYEEGRLP